MHKQMFPNKLPTPNNRAVHKDEEYCWQKEICKLNVFSWGQVDSSLTRDKTRADSLTDFLNCEYLINEKLQPVTSVVTQTTMLLSLLGQPNFQKKLNYNYVHKNSKRQLTLFISS